MVLNLMKKKNLPLIFSLICGLSYFGIALGFIIDNTKSGGMLLAFFFAPAIICGGALIILKAIKLYLEENNKKKLEFLFWSHIVLAVVSLVLALGAII